MTAATIEYVREEQAAIWDLIASTIEEYRLTERFGEGRAAPWAVSVWFDRGPRVVSLTGYGRGSLSLTWLEQSIAASPHRVVRAHHDLAAPLLGYLLTASEVFLDGAPLLADGALDAWDEAETLAQTAQDATL